jgi:hypothetical protein
MQRAHAPLVLLRVLLVLLQSAIALILLHCTL